MNENNQSLTTISPTGTVANYAGERNSTLEFLKECMVENVDYGEIPGTGNKTLHQPGAEKLGKFYGLVPEFELIKEKENFETGFFFYKYKCKLIHFNSQKFAGEAVRSCNSYEKKYRTKTVSEKFATEDERKRAVSKYTDKNNGYVKLKVQKNGEELADDVNTIDAMAQKRAFVAAVRTVTGAAEIFNEEMKDIEDESPRAVLMKKIHVVGAERGFTHKKMSEAAKKRFKVSSMSELDENQLEELCDELEMNWEKVGVRGTPKRIPEQKIEAEEGEIELPEELTSASVPCRECDKQVPSDSPHDYFCSDTCFESYWSKRPNTATSSQLEKERRFNKAIGKK